MVHESNLQAPGRVGQQCRASHVFAVMVALCSLAGGTSLASQESDERPSVVLITVDALRADRLSSYGYARNTSPNIDRLLARGARFSRAWTIEPLTNPALSSLMTSLPPHEHGASRNGLRMREGLDSLPKELARQGWDTAAFVSNWTLKNEISRLGEHFETYQGVFTRRRWFGLFNEEATAEDVTQQALDWLEKRRRAGDDDPVFLWLHYVEPHAPYRYHKDAGRALGVTKKDARKSDRYDTEIRAVDQQIGVLIESVEAALGPRPVLFAFSADHGESLGEHQYWGHGRHLFEPSLRIPMGVVWSGRIQPAVVDQSALILDLAPTILDLLDIDVPVDFAGMSMAPVLTGETEGGDGRVLCVQAHKGAVQIKHDSDRARSKGLLEVGVVQEGRTKMILEVKKERRHLVFDLEEDPGELNNLALEGSAESPELIECFGEITTGLGNLDHLATSRLDAESRSQLKALGYLD